MKLFLKETFLLLSSLLIMSESYGANKAEMERKPNGCQGVSLCHSYPRVDNNNVFISAGFLLEQMRVSGTEIGFTENIAYGSLPKSVKLLRPEMKINWGVTAALGYHFVHDNWFFRSRFDWLSGTGKKSTSSEWNNQVVPIHIWTSGMLAPADVSYFTSMRTRLSINYFDLDSELGRGAYMTESVSLEPHAGFKLAFIYYDQDTKFTGGAAGNNKLKRDQDSQFWGIGPCFGFDTKWYMCDCFSFFCDTTMALLFGGDRIKDTVKYSANSAIYQTVAKESIDAMSPTARAILGFMYEQNLCNDTQHVGVRLGLDTNYYWNQFNRISAVSAGVNNQVNSWNFETIENGTFGTVGLLFDIGWEF